MTKQGSGKPKAEPIDLAVFLETLPPGVGVQIAGANVERKYASGSSKWYNVLTIPSLISLHCGHTACDRTQYYKTDKLEASLGDSFLKYVCRNCHDTVKTFAIRSWDVGDDPRTASVFVYKYGEIPQFGPPLPAKLLQLAGEFGSLLKKGRQSENQGLGIGAFAYYRRVVEKQKSRLIDELKNAIERLGGNSKAIEALETARAENQFSRALEIMADVTPKELFVSGHNPLRLLHGPLSIGLHGLTDEECLKKAHSVRVVMSALLERIQMITEEKTELDASIKELLPPSENSASSAGKKDS